MVVFLAAHVVLLCEVGIISRRGTFMQVVLAEGLSLCGGVVAIAQPCLTMTGSVVADCDVAPLLPDGVDTRMSRQWRLVLLCQVVMLAH